MFLPAIRRTSTWISLLLAAASSALPVCALGQSKSFPKFVVADVRDVTIKTRRTFDVPSSTIETDVLFLKRAWQRGEQSLRFPVAIAAGEAHTRGWITRCDERRTLELDPASRTFASSTIEDIAEHARRRGPAVSDGPPVAATGANVTMTIDAVDTQERRQVGPFLARHVITTTTTEAEPGANARTGTSLRDGWYIDLPPADCWDWGADGPILSALVVRAGSRPDRVHVARRGTARRGFPIEETSRSEDGSPASRITLIEISDKPLDDALFTVPAGYRPALPRLHGGFDMTKPDTLVNRLASYWEEVQSWLPRFSSPASQR
jgi:hypothetical protein